MQRMSKRQKRKIYLVILTILLLILLAVAGYLIYTRYLAKQEPVPEGSAYVDPDASDWDAGIEPSDDEEEGRILIPGYSDVRMHAGDTVLRLRIGNPEENTCYLQAVLQLEDGTALYESGLIEPGKGFDEIELNQTLEAGEYQALVHFTGYTMEDEPQELNSSDSAFVLTVEP